MKAAAALNNAVVVPKLRFEVGKLPETSTRLLSTRAKFTAGEFKLEAIGEPRSIGSSLGLAMSPRCRHRLGDVQPTATFKPERLYLARSGARMSKILERAALLPLGRQKLP